MDSEKDQKVKRIARFLELGGTMLAEHCKVCGAPRFRYQGKVICPVCDVKEEEEEEAQETVSEVQVPEAREYDQKDRPSSEPKKRIQAHRQKPRIGLRNLEAIEEKEKTLKFVERDISKLPPDTVEVEQKMTAPASQVALSEESQKPIKPQTILAANIEKDKGDWEMLEKLLLKKIVSIAASLQDEKNSHSIAENFELINKGLGLIERLRHI
jgi:UPF0148 protein